MSKSSCKSKAVERYSVRKPTFQVFQFCCHLEIKVTEVDVRIGIFKIYTWTKSLLFKHERYFDGCSDTGCTLTMSKITLDGSNLKRSLSLRTESFWNSTSLYGITNRGTSTVCFHIINWWRKNVATLVDLFHGIVLSWRWRLCKTACVTTCCYGTLTDDCINMIFTLQGLIQRL